MRRHDKTTDAVKILHGRYVMGDPERKGSLEQERVNAEVAQMIYDLRTAAELTQKELAKLVGTTQSVISRLEDADYEGHSLSMLTRIAKALRQNLTVVMTANDPEVENVRFAFQLLVRNLRRQRNLTVQELAERTGIDENEIVAMERNPGYRPAPLTLHKLRRFYEIPQERLEILAGAVREVPFEIRESASRYAAQSESVGALSEGEEQLLDRFVKFLKKETKD